MRIKNFVFALGLLISCKAIAAEPVEIIVTIKPLHSLVAGVIGNTGKADVLLEGYASPHDFQLKPSQMRVLQEAKVIFYIDDGFELFLTRVFKMLPSSVKKIPILQNAELNILPLRSGGVWGADKHKNHNHKETEEYLYNNSDMWHQGENQYDMHVWLDPENARRIVAFVAKELSIIYPRHAFAYKQNALKMIAKIDILDDKLKAHLADFQDKPFIVFHDAYQYFEYAYGLKSIGSITFEPDESSTPSRIREIRARLQESGAKCILQEPQFSSRLTRVIADGTNAKGGILDPLGTEIARGKELYFTLQQNLADNLSQCLSSE